MYICTARERERERERETEKEREREREREREKEREDCGRKVRKVSFCRCKILWRDLPRDWENQSQLVLVR